MDLNIIQDITLDFNIVRIKNVRCLENDSNSRTINIKFTNNGELFPLNRNTMLAKYKIHKPDHKYIYNDIPINDNGTITIIIPDQAMTTPGVAKSELQIFNKATKSIISTMPFNIIIEKSVLSNKDIESTIESNVINDMINHLADNNNPHKVTKVQVELGNVDNTSDKEKNVYSAIRDGNKNIIYNEVLSTIEPTNQKMGDYWMVEY